MITLYSIDKKGKIRVFQTELSLTGPISPNTAIISTYTGLLKGELTKRMVEITAGKQRRSINEQAQFEQASLINEKLDEGYKTADMLLQKYEELFGTTPWIEQNEKNYIPNLFDKLKINHNTNQHWLPLPMLAEKWKQHKAKVKYPVLCQPKLNGVRCIAVLSDGVVKLCSRGGQFYIVPHIEKGLLEFLKANPTISLDGELYNHGMPLQEIVGRAKVEDPNQFDRKIPLQYHVYDLAVAGWDQERRLVELGHLLPQSDFVRLVETFSATSEAEIDAAHEKFIGEGYEGAIVRNPLGLYQFGFRDSVLLKVKEFIDSEFEITGAETDETNWQTTAESFVFILKNDINELTFKARPTGTAQDKLTWWTGIDKFVGKKATIRYQERTQDGLPHQAHVRSKDTPMLMEVIRDYE